MNKIWKIFQYGYLIIAIICLIEGVIKLNSGEDSSTAIILLVFSVFITAVFFFKRYFRKKVERRNNLHNNG